jgi:hypothetical protein
LLGEREILQLDAEAIERELEIPCAVHRARQRHAERAEIDAQTSPPDADVYRVSLEEVGREVHLGVGAQPGRGGGERRR